MDKNEASRSDRLNELVAEYVKLKGSDDAEALKFAATAVANFCADIFERPFVATADDGRECQVPHKSSQDVYRNTWVGEGANVDCHSLRLAVVELGHSWHGGKGRNARP